jgi:hypothetical protein
MRANDAPEQVGTTVAPRIKSGKKLEDFAIERSARPGRKKVCAKKWTRVAADSVGARSLQQVRLFWTDGGRVRRGGLSSLAVRRQPLLDTSVRRHFRHRKHLGRPARARVTGTRSRHDQLSRLAPVSSATFLICAIAAPAPAVLVSRSSVASSSSPTGVSAGSI